MTATQFPHNDEPENLNVNETPATEVEVETQPEVTDEAPKKKKLHWAIKTLIIILCVILCLVIALGSALLIMRYKGKRNVENMKVSLIEREDSDFDENAVYHNGKAYYYNENLVNILLLGIDKNYGADNKQGQADAIYLVSVDTEKNKVNIISVSRNAVCAVDVLNSEGEVYGTEQQPICLAYAYGNTDKRSSLNCVKAVEDLLYKVPIGGYYTMYLSSVAEIVDSVNGVKVTIPKDSTAPNFKDRLGKTVTLNGKDALTYLQMRGDSNAPRVERQKAFISSFINSAKAAVKKDLTLPLDMAKKLMDDTVTSVDINSTVYLATEALNWDISFHDVEGEYSVKDNVEYMTVDEDKLRDMVINNFYTDKK